MKMFEQELDLNQTAAVADGRIQAETWSLVLWAAAIPNAAILKHNVWEITVPEGLATAASIEIRDYEDENRDWPPPANLSQPLPAAELQDSPTILLMGALVIFHSITGGWVTGSRWFDAGAVIGGRILNHGQWWRLLTGLTLHIDPVHLLGNVCIGGFIFHFLCKNLGFGLGLASTLFAGTAGNLLNILFQGPGHRSVGFSTAVFAAIGLQVGHQCLRNRRLHWRDIFSPLAAGAGLLAFLGVGDANTDLGAHFFGLLTGLILGVVIAWLPFFKKIFTSALWQYLLFWGALAAVWCSWWLAMTSTAA